MDWQQIVTDVLKLVVIALAPVAVTLLAKIANAGAARLQNDVAREAVKQVVVAVEKWAGGKLSGEAKRAEAVKRLEADGLGDYVPLIDTVVAELDAALEKLAVSAVAKAGGGGA